MGGTVVAALTVPRIAKHWSFATPFRVAAALVAVMAVVFWLVARDAPVPARARPASFGQSLEVFWRSSRAWPLALFYFLSLGGFVAMFLYLPKLLTGGSRAEQDRRRLPGGGFRVSRHATLRGQEAEMKDRLAGGITSLPERERMVVALHYYENLDLREIGQVWEPQRRPSRSSIQGPCSGSSPGSSMPMPTATRPPVILEVNLSRRRAVCQKT